jgi:hypothetical protein
VRASALALALFVVAFSSDARAESGVVEICEDPSFTKCADAAAYSACDCAPATCACISTTCTSQDGGGSVTFGSKCAPIADCASRGDLASCDGKNKGDPCGGDRSCQNAYCFTLVDGGYVQDAGTLACLAPLGGSRDAAAAGSSPSDDAGALASPSGDSDSGGCNVAGAAVASCAPAILVMLIAARALRRRGSDRSSSRRPR